MFLPLRRRSKRPGDLRAAPEDPIVGIDDAKADAAFERMAALEWMKRWRMRVRLEAHLPRQVSESFDLDERVHGQTVSWTARVSLYGRVHEHGVEWPRGPDERWWTWEMRQEAKDQIVAWLRDLLAPTHEMTWEEIRWAEEDV